MPFCCPLDAADSGSHRGCSSESRVIEILPSSTCSYLVPAVAEDRRTALRVRRRGGGRLMSHSNADQQLQSELSADEMNQATSSDFELLLESEQSGNRMNPEQSLDEKKPELSLEEKKPNLSLDEKKPYLSLDEKKPDQSSDEKKSNLSLDEKKPNLPLNEKKSNLSLDEKKPDQSSDEKKPEQSLDEKKPELSLDEKKPELSLDQKKPELSLDEKKSEATSDLELEIDRNAESTGPNISGTPRQEIDLYEPDSTPSGPAKFEVDFNQLAISRSGPAGFAVDFNQPSNTVDSNTTKDGYETDGDDETGESGSRDREGSSGELQAELEGAPFAIPREKRIRTKPMSRKPRQCLVYGKLSIMVEEVSEEALAVPLRCPALSDMLENREVYRAIALRSGCELVFTRRIAVKKMIKWNRYVVLLLRGPSDAALRRLRGMLEATNPAFRQAVPYDAEKPRPRLRTSEQLPDNLDLAICSERIGPAAAGWEQLPLEMPQLKLRPQVVGKPKRVVFPNNSPIGPVLSYVYPKWGFQSSKSIPQGVLFGAAVDAAEKLEKQQIAEQQRGTHDFAVRH